MSAGAPEDEISCKDITCPSCLREVSDSWEYGDGEDEAFDEEECEGCGARFEWRRSITVDYQMTLVAKDKK